VLPFIEEESLHRLDFGQEDLAESMSINVRLQTPLSLFVCPTRRICAPWPISEKYPYVRTPKPFGEVTRVARADYAINAGSSSAISFGGPVDFAQGDDEKFWQTTTTGQFSGISHLRRAVGYRALTDGASKTYLVGEKVIDFRSYDTGESLGDNESQYAGYSTDLHRFAGAIERMAISQSPTALPLSDSVTTVDGLPGHARFGGAHPNGYIAVNCDGSTHFVTFEIDPDVHFRFGHRSDQGNDFQALFRSR
jgi:hypothetical protein